MTHKETKPKSRSTRREFADVFDSAAALPATVALLALAAKDAAAPSVKVKQGLLARIRAERNRAPQVKAAAVPAGWRFESARTAAGWLQTFPGVRFKELSVDAKRDVAMLLVELAPGASFPDHPHETGMEEGIVISGDVTSGGRLLLAGDYYRAEAGTEHTDVMSPSGCVALLSMRSVVWRQLQASFSP